MHELREEQQHANGLRNERERHFSVRVSPTEVRYMTEAELEASISEEDIERGLSLAGAWSDLNIPEEEFYAILERNRQGVEPTPPLSLT
jgi:hypothetical protein